MPLTFHPFLYLHFSELLYCIGYLHSCIMAAPQLWAHSCSCWKDSSSVSGYCSRSHPAWNVDGMVNILFSICIRPSNFLPNLPQIQFTYCNVKYIHQTKYNSFNLLSKMLHPVFAYFYAPVVLIQRNSTELQMW